jgi:hypothetical protein
MIFSDIELCLVVNASKYKHLKEMQSSAWIVPSVPLTYRMCSYSETGVPECAMGISQIQIVR